MRVRERERVPAAGLEGLPDRTANREDDRSVLLGGRGAEDLCGYEDERPCGGVRRLLADREGCASPHDGIELFVAAVLLMRRD